MNTHSISHPMVALTLLSSLLVGCKGGNSDGLPIIPDDSGESSLHTSTSHGGLAGIIEPNKKAFIDLSSFVDKESEIIDVYETDPISDARALRLTYSKNNTTNEQLCGTPELNKQGTGFSVMIKGTALCQYQYDSRSRSNVNTEESGAKVLVFATQNQENPMRSSLGFQTQPGTTSNIQLGLQSGEKLETVAITSGPGLTTGDGSATKSGQFIKYTAPQKPGWQEIHYTVKDTQGTTSLGHVFITISDKTNQAPNINIDPAGSAFNYTVNCGANRCGSNPLPQAIKNNAGNGEPDPDKDSLEFDLSQMKNSDGTSLIDYYNNDWQVSYVYMDYAQSGVGPDAVKLSDPSSVTNKKFKIDTGKLTELAGRDFLVNFVVNNHYGGYSRGAINFHLNINDTPKNKMGNFQNIIPPPLYGSIRDVSPNVIPRWFHMVVTDDYGTRDHSSTYGVVTSIQGLQTYCSLLGRVITTADIQRFEENAIGGYPTAWPREIAILDAKGAMVDLEGNIVDFSKGVYPICAQSSVEIHPVKSTIFHMKDATKLPNGTKGFFIGKYLKESILDTVDLKLTTTTIPDVNWMQKSLYVAYDRMRDDYSIYILKPETPSEALPDVSLDLTYNKHDCDRSDTTKTCVIKKVGGPYYLSGNIEASGAVLSVMLSHSGKNLVTDDTLTMNGKTRTEKLHAQADIQDQDGYPIYQGLEGGHYKRYLDIKIENTRWDKGVGFTKIKRIKKPETNKFCPSSNHRCADPTNRITGDIIASGSGEPGKLVSYEIRMEGGNAGLSLLRYIKIKQVDDLSCDYTQMDTQQKQNMLCVPSVVDYHKGVSLLAAPPTAFIDYIGYNQSKFQITDTNKFRKGTTVSGYNTIYTYDKSVPATWCAYLSSVKYGGKTWTQLTANNMLANTSWPKNDKDEVGVNKDALYRSGFSKNFRANFESVPYLDVQMSPFLPMDSHNEIMRLAHYDTYAYFSRDSDGIKIGNKPVKPDGSMNLTCEGP